MEIKLPQFEFNLIDKKEIVSGTFELTFKSQYKFVFEAGQYVWIIIGDNRRAFSLINSPNLDSEIKILFRISKSIYKKDLLQLKIGDTVNVLGPFGRSFCFPKNNEPLVLVGGGVGVAPFLSLTSTAKATNMNTKINSYYVNSTEVKYFGENYLGTRFNFDLIKNDVNSKNSLFYICGPQGFVDDVYKKLTDAGIEYKNMRFENFYPTTPEVSLLLNIFKDRKNDNEYDLEVLLRSAIESASSHLIVTDVNGIIVFANEAAQKVTGFSLDEMMGNTPRLWGGLMSADFYTDLWNKKLSGESFDGEITNRRKNGEIYYAIAHIAPIKIKDGRIIGFIASEDDITKLKQLDKMKDEFVSIASHELRTPMTAIKGFTSMIMEGDYGEISKNILDPLKSIQISTDRLINLVNDLLNLSRIESGRLKMNLEDTDVCKIIKESVDALIPIAQSKNLKLILEINDDHVLAQTDTDKLRQIITNLVGNSLKFTDRGEIKTILKKEGDFVKVFVSDTGIGIPESEQNRIFGKFEQVTNSTIGRPQGTGLGLFICKMMVEKMGGVMKLEKSTEDKGSEFSFSLPISGSATATEVKEEVKKEAMAHPDQK